MNRATLIGNLTRDPDLRMTNGGVSVCTFSIAVQRRFANQQGERPADFFNIVCWRGAANICTREAKWAYTVPFKTVAMRLRTAQSGT